MAAGANCCFPPELVEGILINLPVSSLNRFRRVSKAWQSLISDNRFVKKHLTAHTNNLSHKKLIAIPTHTSMDYKLFFIPFSPLPIEGDGPICPRCPLDGDSWDFLASCNGLICMDDGQSLIYIWNPCLNEYKKVRSQSYDNTIYRYEFGYDSMRDDYRLIKLSTPCDCEEGWDPTRTEMYSLKSDSWITLTDFPQGFYPTVGSAYFNGSFYWLAYALPDRYSRRMPYVIYSFDPSENKYREVRLPPCLYRAVDRMFVHVESLCILKGMLCVFVRTDSWGRSTLWVMKDYTCDIIWTEILDSADDPDLREMCRHLVRPVYIYENGDVMMWGDFKQGLEVVVVCNDNTVLCRKRVSKRRYNVFEVHVESLVSPLRVNCGTKQLN